MLAPVFFCTQVISLKCSWLTMFSFSDDRMPFFYALIWLYKYIMYIWLSIARGEENRNGIILYFDCIWGICLSYNLFAGGVPGRKMSNAFRNEEKQESCTLCAVCFAYSACSCNPFILKKATFLVVSLLPFHSVLSTSSKNGGPLLWLKT